MQSYVYYTKRLVNATLADVYPTNRAQKNKTTTQALFCKLNLELAGTIYLSR